MPSGLRTSSIERARCASFHRSAAAPDWPHC
jgi:hypothetical protein